MDFAYTPKQEALRREVRQFIKENVTTDIVEEINPEAAEERRGMGPKAAGLYKKIYERGWLGITYPKEYGGQGGDRLTQYIVEEEFTRAGINVTLGGSGAPAIMAAGTEEQKQFYIPRLIKREVSFCLGFTEPHAGADLANLRCSAVRDGDDYVINGQKMYTTGAHRSQCTQARRHFDFPVSDGHARHHRAPAVDDTEQSDGAAQHDLRRSAHQRNVLRRRAHPQIVSARRGEQRLAR